MQPARRCGGRQAGRAERCRGLAGWLGNLALTYIELSGRGDSWWERVAYASQVCSISDVIRGNGANLW